MTAQRDRAQAACKRGANRVGAFILGDDAITGSNNGPEVFYIVNTDNVTVIPEPGMLSLMAMGLPLAFGGLSRLRRRRH